MQSHMSFVIPSKQNEEMFVQSNFKHFMSVQNFKIFVQPKQLFVQFNHINTRFSLIL